jgi:tetratricopeptide (TPR) repeat protein
MFTLHNAMKKQKNTGETKIVTPQNIRVTTVADKKTLRIIALCCAMLAFLLYANTLGHEYTVDDGTVIENNKITKKGISAIPEIFSTSYRKGFWDRNEGLYRPLSVAMFAIEWELVPKNPWPGHLMNVILFALTVYLLFMLLASIFKEYSLFVPMFAAVLFAIHPIHTEVVANIKSRDEILCLLFVILTFKWLHDYLQNKNIVLLILSAIAFFMAYLSKESAITIVGVIPFFIWFFSKASIPQNVKISSLYFGVTGVYLLLRYQILGEMRGSAEIQLINNSILGASSGMDQFGTAMAIMGKYLYLLVIPHPLVFDYSYNQIPVVSIASAGALISLIIYGALAFYAVKGVAKKDAIAFGIIFFAITVSLVSNVLFLIESTMAERFIYMPSIGFCIAIAVLISKAFKLSTSQNLTTLKTQIISKPILLTLVVVLFAGYSVKTIARNNDWENNLKLLAADVKSSPNSARIRYAYGSALLIEKGLKEENLNVKNGFLDRSIAELQKGVAILPSYGEAWYHLGLAYKERGNAGAAVPAFEQARSYKDFKEADFYISSGLAYGLTGKFDLAIRDFTRAIEIDPSNPEAYNNKGLYFSEKGTIDSAMIFLDKAIAMKPEFHQAIYNKGNTFAKANNFPAAIEQYNKALELKPGYTDAVLNLGNCYAAMQDYKNALIYYRKVEEADPGNHKVIYNIGITYKFLGDEANAALYMDKAAKLQGAK